MKFCYNTNFTLPKQSQRSRSVLQADLDLWDCFGRKKLRLITEEIRYTQGHDALLGLTYLRHPVRNRIEEVKYDHFRLNENGSGLKNYVFFLSLFFFFFTSALWAALTAGLNFFKS